MPSWKRSAAICADALGIRTSSRRSNAPPNSPFAGFLNKNATDDSKVKMGRWVTVIGVIISIGTAYLVMHAQSIMDYVQALFSFFIAPLFGTVLLGMLWKRATPAGGWAGLLAGTLSSVGMYTWVKLDPNAVRYVALSMDAQDQAQNMFRALWCCLICVIVTVVVSLVTKPKPDSELRDVVYGLTPIPKAEHTSWFHSPIFWGAVVAIAFVILQIIFW